MLLTASQAELASGIGPAPLRLENRMPSLTAPTALYPLLASVEQHVGHFIWAAEPNECAM